jgi:hypothetical protein
MRTCFCIVAAIFITAYLLACRSDWFTDVARSGTGRSPVFTETLDLRKAQTIVWRIPPQERLYRRGKAQLSLVLNQKLLRQIPDDRSQVELRAKVTAFGVREDGSREDRWVQDRYYTTDEPFSQSGQGLWAFYGLGRIEYGLGAVGARPDEELVIEVTVTQPDPQLALGNPRLKLVEEHDPAAWNFPDLLLGSLSDVGLALSLLFLIGLLRLAWNGPTKITPATAAVSASAG